MQKPGLEVIKLFSCSTQLRKKFQLLIKTNILTNKEVSCFKSLKCCIYHANKCQNANIVGILTLISRINFVISCVKHEKSFIASGPGLLLSFYYLNAHFEDLMRDHYV